MRKTLLFVIAGLLLLAAGCAFSTSAGFPAAKQAATTSRSIPTTPAPGEPPLTRRDAVPEWAVPYEKKVVVGVVTRRKAVALTIDDVGATEMKALVDTLVANDLHATLFCVGSTMTTEAASYAAAANGIELANHSWVHKSIGWYRPYAANEQIMRTARLLKAGSGEWPLWYRSPFQLYQSQGRKAVADSGMLIAGISNDPLDYHGYTGAQLVGRMSRSLKPGQIIMVHHYDRTIDTLPAIAAELDRRGYETMTMSELSQLGPPATTNWQLEPFARYFGH